MRHSIVVTSPVHVKLDFHQTQSIQSEHKASASSAPNEEKKSVVKLINTLGDLMDSLFVPLWARRFTRECEKLFVYKFFFANRMENNNNNETLFR
jgi:hypothetical protein